jgi:hypothetical protein
MGIVEKERMCCMHCLYWHGCLVIAKNNLVSFSCSDCFCKLFERNDKPTFNDKLRRNNWKIPKIINPSA